MITTEKLLEGRDGIRFFGDVQGMADAFLDLARDALAKNLALFSLGDLIDRGNNSPGCMRIATALYRKGLFDLVPGNHDDKFCRWMQGRAVNVAPEGLGLTISQLSAAPDGQSLGIDYFDMVMEALLWRRFGNIYAVHASMLGRMFGNDGPKLLQAISKTDRYRALLGEVSPDEMAKNGRPKRLFNWIEEIPADAIVLVGHTVVSLDRIVERRNAAGGRCLHLDTGLDRGGKLSYLDVPKSVLLGEAKPDIPAFDLFAAA